MRKNAQHVKKYFLADSKKKNDAYFAWRFACCCFQKAARFLFGENASCHIARLTALQSAHPWTVEKEIQRE